MRVQSTLKRVTAQGKWGQPHWRGRGSTTVPARFGSGRFFVMGEVADHSGVAGRAALKPRDALPTPL